MFVASARVRATPVSASAALTALARELAAGGADVIPLSLGEPDFDTPPHAVAAADAAARAGETRYPPQPGTVALRQAVQRKFRRDNGLDYALEILAANGGTQVIFDAFMASLDPGDEVLIPTPGWIDYANIARFAGGTPVALPCGPEDGFRPTPAALEAAITSRTRWLVLNFPNNPTGAACSPKALRALAEVLLRHPQVLVLSDDMYEHILYDGASFHTMAQVEPRLRERILTVNGVSKTYAMTGWRVGFCGGPKPLIQAMLNVQGRSTSGICSIAQAAAAAALDGPQDSLAHNRGEYQARRDMMLAMLAEAPDLSCHRPEGAFYLFPDISACLGRRTREGTRIESDQDFVMALLRERHVATVYGAAYGLSSHIRLSYAAAPAVLREGWRRLVEFCDALQ